MTPHLTGGPATTQAGTVSTGGQDPPRCAADPDTIRAWLGSPSAEDPTLTVAEHLNVDDWFRVNDEFFSQTVDRLLYEGQEAGVFGAAGRRVQLWDVADKEEHQFIGHLLTVDQPDGSRLASEYIDPGFGVEPGRYGVDAALAAFDDLAYHTNYVLARGGPSAEASGRQQRQPVENQMLAGSQQLDRATAPAQPRQGSGSAASSSQQQTSSSGRLEPYPPAASHTASAPTAAGPPRLAATSFAAPATSAAGAGAAAPAAGTTAAQVAAAARAAGATSHRRKR